MSGDEFKHGNGRWPVDRVLTTFALVMSLAALVFSAGVNWARVTTLQESLKEHIMLSDMIYVRKDISDARWDRVEEQLQQMRDEHSQQYMELKELLMPSASAAARRAADSKAIFGR